MPIETEIKFRVDSLAALAEQLQSAGFRLVTPRSFESNVLYDTPDRQMRARTEILRIRSYAGRWTLTLKRLPRSGPAPDSDDRGPREANLAFWGGGDARHKHRVETETGIADGDALAEVFLSLGLVVAFRYEKWRTEWTDGEGHCVIDETPIGDYAELEGSSTWIDRTAARLGVEPARYVTLSYGRLFEAWREEHSSSANDLTFAAIAKSPAAR
jgi:adenylate cyclase, class 2